LSDNCLKDPRSEDNIQLGYGLQSWKYFHKYDTELRRQLTFQKHIQNTAEQTIGKIFQKRKIKSRKSITLVGVHIRRGDKVGNHDGFNIATPEYLNRSVNYYAKMYTTVLFLVISDDIAWSKTNMPTHVPVEFISLGKREFDMASVVACDHTIMTIGTFGWWIGYLTGGEVVYVKDAAKKGSRFERILNFEDHFYPQWGQMSWVQFQFTDTSSRKIDSKQMQKRNNTIGILYYCWEKKSHDELYIEMEETYGFLLG
ncbi:hypothetical protein AM593_08641, partial [Mytilus galloprovincialis]